MVASKNSEGMLWLFELRQVMAMSPQKRGCSSQDDNADAKKFRSAAHKFMLSAENIDAIKEHFIWVCGRSKALDINKSYLASKVPGFQKEGDHWDIITNILMSMGLAFEAGKARANAQPGFIFVKPVAPEDLTFVCEAIEKWLGLDAVKSKTFVDNMQGAKGNDNFSKLTFEVVLKQLRGEEVPRIAP